MVKTPRTRHSQTTRDPVTIDLTPEEVSRVKAAEEAAAESAKEAAAEAESRAAEAASSDNREEVLAAGEAEVSASTPADDPLSNELGFGRKPDEASDTGGPAAPVEKRRSGSGAFAAGITGGVIALAVAGGLHYAGLIPENRVAGPDYAPAISALETEIATLRDQMSAIGGTQGDAALEGRVTEAETRVNALNEAVEALRGQLAAIQLPADGGAPSIDLSPIEERVATMETAVAELRNAPAPQADLSAIEAVIASLRQEIGAAREAQGGALTRLDAVESELQALSSRLEEQAETPATAVIIAASALKSAIDRGGPFTAELDTLAALAPSAPEIEQLRAYAEKGVATRTQLAEEADAAANAMIAAGQTIDPEAGITDRLWSSAMALVQVRPIGMVEGDGVPEIAARIDAAVGAGDFERAIAEFENLPEAAKSAGTPFMDRIRARQTVEALVDQALAAALKA